MRSIAISTIFAGTVGIVLVSLVLLATLLVKPFVLVWNDFIAGWVAGFVISALAYRIVRQRRQR